MPLANDDQRAAFMARPTPAERLFRVRQHIGALRDQYAILRVALANGDAALTERERWLFVQGFSAGYYSERRSVPIEQLATAWLNGDAADAVTVEMVLAKDAPSRHENTLLEQVVDEMGRILQKLETV